MPAKSRTKKGRASRSKQTASAPAKVMMYCLKCREHTETAEVEATTMKNGSPATRGVCATCGTKKYKIGSVAA